MARKLGVLTLGQTPRKDVTPTLQGILGKRVQIVEKGGLDGFSESGLLEVMAQDGEAQIETRLRSGAAITVRKEAILLRLVDGARQLASECDAVLLLCSGEFPALAEACPRLIQPIHILRGAIHAVARRRLLGLIGPASDLEEAPGQWAPYAPRVVCAAASPYEPIEAAVRAGRDLAGQGAEVIYMDDMGFNERQRMAVARSSKRPVLCATTLTARVLREIL
ncbi:MAG TPA: AroM family protein [Holophaga sp.]|nr:AroM family protein [Holophaga sp.]